MKKICCSILMLFCLPFPALADETDHSSLFEVLQTIDKQYISTFDAADLTYHGLQALHDLDTDISITKGSDRFYMYHHKQIYKIFPFPDDNRNWEEWSRIGSQIIDSAKKISQTISLKDFEVPDKISKKMVARLDPYSHFYSRFDYQDNEAENSIYTLYSERLIEGNILYLRVRTFNTQTAEQVKQSFNNHPNIKGVILDLRGNSGGILNEALKVCDMLTDNEIITYTAGRDNRNMHYYTSNEGSLYDGPLVILTDGDTASAAEVIAGGLQEQSRAKIIGTQTFGKGTIQNVIPLQNGGKLVLTTEQFFTPSGKIIHAHGIQPDICVTEVNDGICAPEPRLRMDEDIEQAVNLLKNQIR